MTSVDKFQLIIPKDYNLPVIDNTALTDGIASTTFVDRIGFVQGSFDPYSDIKIEADSNGDWMVEFSNLPSVTKIGEEPVMFKFKAQAPGSYTEIDPSRIACKIFEGADEKFSGFFPSQTSVVVGAAAGL